MSEDIVIDLKKSITQGEEEITQITLREPTAGDYEKCGYPLIIGDGTSTPDAKVIVKLIAACGKIPPPIVKQLGSADFNACMGAILSFLA
jgi:phage FluMu protein gp41